MNLPACSLWDDSPSDKISIDEGDVHLWRIPLDLSPRETGQLRKLLGTDELARADRLLDPARARFFIAARGRMRQVLARYLGIAPGDVNFDYGENGKPCLGGNVGREPSFNLSHAGGLALLAVTKGAEVGVDAELIDRRLDYERLAAQFFSPHERVLLERYDIRRRRRGFYRIWTGKEASLKCLGHGFSLPGKGHDRDERSLPDAINNKMTMKTFHVAGNYVAALAVAGEILRLKRWHLER